MAKSLKDVIKALIGGKKTQYKKPGSSDAWKMLEEEDKMKKKNGK